MRLPEIITATEATARSLDSQSDDRLRFGVSHTFRVAKPLPANFDRKLHMAVKALKRDKDIIILPADKGNVTVVMDRSEYEEKLNGMLKDDYRQLKRDPTMRIKTKVKKAIKELEEHGYITAHQRTFLVPQHSTPPQLYGLPKIHKEKVPLRPIVAAIGFPMHRCSQLVHRGTSE